MKKLLLLTLVLLGGVMQVSAQRTISNHGQIYIKNSVGWENVYLHIWNTKNNANNTDWPGDKITETKEINGTTYYYKDFDLSVYGEDSKIVVTNGTGSGNENQTVDWNNTKLDLFLDVKSGGSGKKTISRIDAYYLWDNTNSTCSLIEESVGNNGFTTILDNFTTPKDYDFLIVNTSGFNGKPDLSGANNNNVFRPNGAKDETLEFKVKAADWTWNNKSAGVFQLKTTYPAFYEFTFTSDHKYSYIAYIPKNITSVGYATLGTPADWKMKVPENVTAYYVTGVADGEATMSSAITKDNTLPGNNGFLLQGAEDDYKFYASNDDPVSTTGNKMVSTGENGVAASSVPATAYILALNDKLDEACFYKYSGTGDISAFKAYLNADGISAKSLAFNFDGNDDEEEVTGINAIANTVDSNAAMFNLAGQRVNNNYKGVVVKNGKKFIVK